MRRFNAQKEHFTKTGPRQTQGKLKKRDTVFSQEIDADGNGTICYQEFKTFLLTEGVVTVTGSSSESMDGGENGFFGTVVFVKAEK